MADNTTLPGTGDVIASDDIGGVKHQRVKVEFGGDGVATDVSAATPLPVTGAITVTANSVISVVNSTTVTLGIGAVFTGVAEDVTEYTDVRVTVFADAASAVDGLQIQQSSNGTNWDISDNYSIPAGTGKTFSVAASAKFYRTVYTNGGAAQAAFRLQAKFNKGYTKGSSVRPQDARTNDNDYEESLSYLMGFNNVSWDRLRLAIKGVQASSALAVQALKDSGRVNVAIISYQAAGIITTEALFAATAFSRSLDGAVATTGNSFTVTAGKRFRIQAIECSIKNTAAVAGTSKLALRYAGVGGVISNTSPILAIWDVGSSSVTANTYIGPVILSIADGIELLGGGTFGFTNLSSAATMLHTITLSGFEY